MKKKQQSQLGKKASPIKSAVISEYQHVEELKEIHICHYAQIKLQMNKKSQHKTNHTVPHKRESENPIYLIGSLGLKIRVQKQH